MNGGKITSFDIAYEAGVSQSTVSRALRDSPLVGKETRQKIKEIARKLNYKVDKNARNLRSKTTNTLAVLIFQEPGLGKDMINPFFLTMIGSITRAAAEHQYDVLLSFQQLSEDWYADYQESNRADGVICLGYGEYLNYLKKAENIGKGSTNLVTWGPVTTEQQSCFIGCDNTKSAMLAVDHLIDLGNKKIAFIGGADDNCPEFKQRFLGYRQSLANAGISFDAKLQRHAENAQNDGYAAIQELINAGMQIDAIFAASDLIAIGAIKALKDNNIRIPEDVAIVGFDDIPTAAFMTPALTTIRQNTHQAGRILVNKVLQAIAGEKPKSELLPAELIIRESCSASSHHSQSNNQLCESPLSKSIALNDESLSSTALNNTPLNNSNLNYVTES